MPRSQRQCANIFELQALEVRRFLTVASITNATHTLNVTGTSGAETITLTRNGNNVTVSGVGGSFAMGSGNNQFNKINIDAGGSNDLITITGTPTGTGTTATTVSYLNATIGGGGGNDTIVGGNGPDVISGGSGFDTVNYSTRTVNITVTMDGAANDGRSGEADNITSDNEEVITGSGNDSFTGNGNDNFFAGGAGSDTAKGGGGNDVLTGSTGKDSLLGEVGDDFLQAKNNDVDTVNGGGAGNDLAEVDGVDVSSAARLAALALAPSIDRSQLDPDYDTDGKNTGPDLNWDQLSASAIDSQGRVIIVGTDSRTNGFGYSSDDMVAMRYNADGTVDTGFGYNGEAVINFDDDTFYPSSDNAYGVTTDANGNVYIVGSSAASQNGDGFSDEDFALVKLNSGGQRDSVFGNNGTAVEDLSSPFHGGGYNDQAHDVIVDGLGNVIVVGSQNNFSGSDIAVLRFTNQGFLDSNFNEIGQAFLDVNEGNSTFDIANAVALQPNGNFPDRIIVAGASDTDSLLARFNDDGTIDTTFGGLGYGYSLENRISGAVEQNNDVAVDANNIFTVGEATTASFRGTISSNPFAGTQATVTRYSSNGVVEFANSYQTDAMTFTSVVIDPSSGHLIVAGANATDFLWGDVLPTTLSDDPNFNGANLIQLDFTPPSSGQYFDVALEVGVTSDGKVLLGGFSDTNGNGEYQGAVARYGKAVSTGPQDTTDEVEKFINYDDMHQKPPTGLFATRIQNLSGAAKLYILAQPDSQGRSTFDLSNANDTVTITKGTDQDGNPQIFVNVNGFVMPFDTATTTLFRFNMLGGNDTLLTGPGVSVPMYVYAGDGNDLVNTGDGNDLIDGGKGIDILYAGKGNDVVLGGADTDVIGGDEGNDLVIGGTGVDGLFGGGSGEDILIGGTTSHDTNESALLAIISEWGSGNTRPDRINHLRGTLPNGANGTVFLKVGSGATVFNDTSVDGLTGGSGQDWFFRKNSNPNKDQILDNTSGEEVTNM